MSDHEDSPYGYQHITLAFERAPGVDYEAVFEAVCEVIWDKVCQSNGTACTVEHHESMTGTRCLFPEDGEPMVTHTDVQGAQT